MTFALTLGMTALGPVAAPGKYLNRHGLITGVTGTGKSVSLMGMAEAMQRLGVPSIVTDIKGDLSGLAAPAVTPSTRPGGEIRVSITRGVTPRVIKKSTQDRPVRPNPMMTTFLP